MTLADTARLVASLELQDRFSRPASQVEGSLGRLERGVGRVGRAFDVGLGFIGAQVAMRAASGVFGLIRDSAIGMNAELETSQLQFETLLGDADAAADHVKGLFAFAARTPFETGPIIEASRIMRTFGGGALDSTENLTLFGDAAAATSAPIEEVAMWSSRLYANLQAGRPFGEAAQRLGELGIMTPQVRSELEDLQEEGADGITIWRRYQRELGRFGGSMDRQARSWKGLTSSIKDNLGLLGATTFRPIFDTAKAGLEDLLGFLSTPEATAGAEAFAARLAEVINPGNLREAVATISDFVRENGPKFQEVFANIPWASVQDAMRLMGTGSKAILDAFTGLPPWVQTAVLTAWGTNKLTGGLLGGIVNSLASGLVRGVLGMNAGVVNINAASVTGGPGGGVGGGSGSVLPRLLGAATVVGGGVVIGSTVGNALNEPVVDPARQAALAGVGDVLQTGSAGDVSTAIHAIQQQLTTDDPLAMAALILDVNGVRTTLEQQRSLLNERLAVLARAGVDTNSRLREGQSMDERQSAQMIANLQAIRDKQTNVTVNVTTAVSISDVQRRLTSMRIATNGTGGITFD